MTWGVAVAGTVTLDDVTTPHGRRRDQPGGSAVYFALAAARYAPVILCGIVGEDGVAPMRWLADRGIHLDGLSVVGAPTSRWTAVHDYERWVTASESFTEGAGAHWSARLPPSAAAAPVLFVGSMRPDLQSRVLGRSRARLIGVDSMRSFISAAPERVGELVRAADLLFLDRSELALVTASSPPGWREAARSLCGRGRLRAVIVKAGPEGAACVTATACHELPALDVTAVVDPTGAGDALAGGFLGSCARAERDDDGHWPVALGDGLACAAAAVSGFGFEALAAGAAG